MRLSHIFSGLLVVSLLSSPVFAQEAAPAAPAESAAVDMARLPEPMSFIKGKYSEALALNKQAAGDDRDAKIKALVDDLADYDDLAKRSLGDRWDTLSTEKQAEFKGTFREMLELMYTKKIADKHFSENKKVEWDRVVKTRTAATVSCFTQQKDIETEVEIVLHPGVISWKVYDVLLDGASLASTYRKKYAKQLDEKGIDSILADMKKEIAALKAK